jgi:serine/threonine-protein kinase
VIDIGTTLNQRFRLEKELGRGGMGAVYSATDLVLQRNVAIKVLKDQSGEDVGKRLRLEAQIAARLLHDNVVRIYDFGQAEGTWYLVMEQVDGTSYVKRWRNLTLSERLRVLAGVADALDYAHHQGVIHRDIKPGNVLLSASDIPKLSDFGLSLLADRADEAGTIRGTPHYMSPEQSRGKRLDYRTDLYSLGVMLYESATGSVPFTGNSMSVLAQHMGTPPEPPRARNPGVSDALQRLILSLLAKKPTERPASGGAVAAALREEVERIQAQESPAAPEAGAAAEAEPQPELPLGLDMAAVARLQESASDERQRHLREGGRGGAAAPRIPLKSPLTAAPPPANAADLVASPLVRQMLRRVLDEPVMLSADERYLMGHYLAYLLIGARRRPLLKRRESDRRNADRARFLLAMTYALASGPTEEAVQEAARLLDERIDVRPALSPVVVAKYLGWRETVPRTRLFRQTRKALQETSTYAREHMLGSKGMLNPGLVPQTLDDLRKVAPARTEVDDVLVERWNRLADAWRDHPEFRDAALRFTSRQAHRDPASQALWPEVVYPLIELARWQRRSRPWAERLWDGVVGKILHIGDAGTELDRLLARSVSAQVVAQIDDSVNELARRPPRSEEDVEDEEPAIDETARFTATLSGSATALADIAEEDTVRDTGLVSLANPDPHRFLLGQLQELWKEGINALSSQVAGPMGSAASGVHKAGPSHRHIPIGPYRLVVVPSIRGRAAGQLAIQGMPNKQIELTTPSFRTMGSATKPILAVWLYQDNSLALAHLDFQGTPRYVVWHAPRAHELKFDTSDDALQELETLGLEIPDQFEDALSRRFRPGPR